jgi:hypothetical protein
VKPTTTRNPTVDVSDSPDTTNNSHKTNLTTQQQPNDDATDDNDQDNDANGSGIDPDASKDDGGTNSAAATYIVVGLVLVALIILIAALLYRRNANAADAAAAAGAVRGPSVNNAAYKVNAAPPTAGDRRLSLDDDHGALQFVAGNAQSTRGGKSNPLYESAETVQTGRQSIVMYEAVGAENGGGSGSSPNANASVYAMSAPHLPQEPQYVDRAGMETSSAMYDTGQSIDDAHQQAPRPTIVGDGVVQLRDEITADAAAVAAAAGTPGTAAGKSKEFDGFQRKPSVYNGFGDDGGTGGAGIDAAYQVLAPPTQSEAVDANLYYARADMAGAADAAVYDVAPSDAGAAGANAGAVAGFQLGAAAAGQVTSSSRTANETYQDI